MHIPSRSHLVSSTVAKPSRIEMACCGQTRTQAPVPRHFLRSTTILLTPEPFSRQSCNFSRGAQQAPVPSPVGEGEEPTLGSAGILTQTPASGQGTAPHPPRSSWLERRERAGTQKGGEILSVILYNGGSIVSLGYERVTVYSPPRRPRRPLPNKTPLEGRVSTALGDGSR